MALPYQLFDTIQQSPLDGASSADPALEAYKKISVPLEPTAT